MDLIDLANTSTDNLKQHYQEHLYHDNVVDYALLLMAHNILDNNMKNLHISCVNVNEHETFLFTPWDLDCSLGGYWNGSHYDYTTNPSILTCNRLYTKILIGNVEDFCGSLKKRWMELSAGILSTERFNSRLDAYAQAFKESGAWERERNKWNNNPVPLDLEEELAYVKDWYVSNIAQMNYLLEVPTDHVPFVLQNPEENEQVIYSLDGKRQIFQPRTGGVFLFESRKLCLKNIFVLFFFNIGSDEGFISEFGVTEHCTFHHIKIMEGVKNLIFIFTIRLKQHNKFLQYKLSI